MTNFMCQFVQEPFDAHLHSEQILWSSQTIPLGQAKPLLPILEQAQPQQLHARHPEFLTSKCPETLSYGISTGPSFPVLLQYKLFIFSRPQRLFTTCLAGLAEGFSQELEAILVGIGWP